MPKKHRPSSMTTTEVFEIQIKYGIGYDDGMLDGPFEHIEEALETPGEEGIFIFELPSDRKLWRWIENEGNWEEIE